MTDVSLKEYLEKQVHALRERVDTQNDVSVRALDLAQRTLHDKFEETNRFRAQITEERGVFVRYEVANALEKRITQLEISAANTLGRWWIIGLVASGLGAGLGLVVARMMGGH